MKKISLLLFTLLILTACGGIDKTSKENNASNAEIISNNQLNMKILPEKGDNIAIMKTSHGDINILLYADKTPETANNFIEHSRSGKYDNVAFHRVIDNFMIQGGDFENGDGSGGYSYKGPGTTLEDEFGEGLTHLRGAISMANAGPNTGGSQFFIVQRKGGTKSLDGIHAIFGYVYDGMDTVDEIATTETDYYDKPVEDAVIKSIEITEY